jgi:TPR repeat protein
MQTQYPPIEAPEDSYPAVDAWLIKISNEGYTEKEVEEMMTFIKKLVEKDEIAQAAQLLLISAATHSKYAQFILARALFRGDILQRNLPEAFTLINRLAMDDDYPEAICDLGQMYENGIGIDKDRKRAEELYKEAMELGIKRAATHYERIRHSNKSLLSKLLGK